MVKGGLFAALGESSLSPDPSLHQVGRTVSMQGCVEMTNLLDDISAWKAGEMRGHEIRNYYRIFTKTMMCSIKKDIVRRGSPMFFILYIYIFILAQGMLRPKTN